jgi:hypothetical protein
MGNDSAPVQVETAPGLAWARQHSDSEQAQVGAAAPVAKAFVLRLGAEGAVPISGLRLTQGVGSHPRRAWSESDARAMGAYLPDFGLRHVQPPETEEDMHPDERRRRLREEARERLSVRFRAWGHDARPESSLVDHLVDLDRAGSATLVAHRHLLAPTVLEGVRGMPKTSTPLVRGRANALEEARLPGTAEEVSMESPSKAKVGTDSPSAQTPLEAATILTRALANWTPVSEGGLEPTLTHSRATGPGISYLADPMTGISQGDLAGQVTSNRAARRATLRRAMQLVRQRQAQLRSLSQNRTGHPPGEEGWEA